MAIGEKKVVFNQSVLVGRAVENYDRRVSDKVFLFRIKSSSDYIIHILKYYCRVIVIDL